jgi:hypothetical protein
MCRMKAVLWYRDVLIGKDNLATARLSCRAYPVMLSRSEASRVPRYRPLAEFTLSEANGLRVTLQVITSPGFQGVTHTASVSPEVH